jgi:hypothetical protein
MNPKTAHYILTRLWRIRLGYFVAAAIVLSMVAVISLRHNNEHMAQLRDAVYAADEKGSGVDQALQELRAYVTAHMNTSLTAGNDGVYPPIQLKYTYSRLVQAAGANTANANATIYSDAQKSCEGQIPTGFSGRYRLDCIEQYVQSHGGAPVTNIPDSLYKFDFVSPTWSPDLAGLSLLASILLFLFAGTVAVVRSVLYRLSR